jgi:hypothetical protein
MWQAAVKFSLTLAARGLRAARLCCRPPALNWPGGSRIQLGSAASAGCKQWGDDGFDKQYFSIGAVCFCYQFLRHFARAAQTTCQMQIKFAPTEGGPRRSKHRMGWGRTGGPRMYGNRCRFYAVY